MNDTSPKMQKIYHDMLMARSNEERFMMGLDMFAFSRALIVAGLPTNLSEDEKRRMIYERTYGEPAPWKK